MLSNSENRVRFLLISDIHESIPLNRVRNYIEKIIEENPIDIILIGGDLGSIKHEKDYIDEIKNVLPNEEDWYGELFLKELSGIGYPILWIPGNHDSISSFQLKQSNNMHNKCVEIAPALWLLGIGGSCPAYDKNGSMIWNGYPYLEKDIEIKEGIQALKKIPASNSIILFTHCPPSLAPSGHVVLPEKQVELWAGSESLSQLLEIVSSQYPVPLYLHGHCHKNLASNIIRTFDNATVVLSAGSIRDKYCVTVELERREEKWSVSKQNLITLPPVEEDSYSSLLLDLQ